ncbi:MAG: hypothetical protein ABIH67_03820 [Candidatus Uhrbacteria bacterium]
MNLTFEDKQNIFKLIDQMLEQDLTELQRLINQADQESINAPGKMQSWSDTSKDEYANVRNSLQKVFTEKQGLHNQIKLLEVKVTDTIGVGSIFSVNEGDIYIVLPIGGLGKIKYQDADILVVGANAPLYSAIQGLSNGQQFTWPNGKESIIEHII